MRIAILSDIHANLAALSTVLDDIGVRGGVERIVCLGDVVGYNTEPAECIELIRRSGALCVAGNHDRAAVGLIPTKTLGDTARRAVNWTRSRLDPEARAFLAGLPLEVSFNGCLVAVHGALGVEGGCEQTYLDTDARRQACLDALTAHPSGARICAFGHTHEPGVFTCRDGAITAVPGDELRLDEDAFYLINPGTVGQPRHSEEHATYMILDAARRVLTVRRVPYDIAAVRAKTQKAGLTPRFTPVQLIWALRRRVGRLRLMMRDRIAALR